MNRRAPVSRSPRELWLFATLWSLRQYPTKAREWSWEKKFAAIRDARFDGVFSPPIPEVAGRGDLRYLAVTSLTEKPKVEPALKAAKALGALAIDVQLGDFDSKLADMVSLAVCIRDVARDLELPYAIETHRDTFTETPEATQALARGFRRATRTSLPLCLDHSHFAVVRHLARDQLWERLKEPTELLEAATQFHLRPFNGHHCQIPVRGRTGRRTPEYLDWLQYSGALLCHLRHEWAIAPVLAVPELGHAAPAYGLSCFGDTWLDAQTVAHDLRRQWRTS
ncbi:MAG: xylose isomerase [Opitutus sp.]